jgi:hypothetical protein
MRARLCALMSNVMLLYSSALRSCPLHEGASARERESLCERERLRERERKRERQRERERERERLGRKAYV